MPKCPQTQYIGETKNTLKQRFYQHRSNINKNTGTLVTQHLNQHDYSLSDFRCIITEKTTHFQPQQQTKKRNVLDAQIENCHPSRPQHFVLISCPPPLLAYFSGRGLVDMAGTCQFSEYACLRSGYMLPAPVVGIQLCYVGLHCLYSWGG